MQYFIEDFIEETNAIKTHDEAFLLYQQAIQKLGFNSAVYTFLTDHPSAHQKAGHGVQCNYPSDWMKYYWEKGYKEIDPVILRVLRGSQPFSWKELFSSPNFTKKQITILEEASEAGLRNGVGIPLYGARGELAGVGLASDHIEELADKNTLCKLKLLTEQFHLVYCGLGASSESDSEIPNLTFREIEILKWWAMGKTGDEIALILNCSKSNIKFHIGNIYTKLEANSKILAVTKAIRLGFIPADSLKI